jgi:hypothetical protein
LLENGAYLTDPSFGSFQNQVYAEGGDIDAFTLRMVKSRSFKRRCKCKICWRWIFWSEKTKISFNER